MSTMLEFRPDPVLQRFADWFETPLRWLGPERRDEMMRVEETVEDGRLVIKAEMPGIDPETDVDIELDEGLLTISAERREEERREEQGTTISEFRYGSFRRTLRVPRDVAADSIEATYTDGILTITVPLPDETSSTATKVPVTRK